MTSRSLMKTPNFFGGVNPQLWATQQIESEAVAFLVKGGSAQDWVSAMQAQCANAEKITNLYQKAKGGDDAAMRQIAEETDHDYDQTVSFITGADNDSTAIAALLKALGGSPDTSVTNRL